MNPPLKGVRVVEFEGIGPGPLAGRMLADPATAFSRFWRST